MPGFLRQATAAQVRSIGPFIDDTDFKSAKTGLTIANTDIKLVINGAASANKNAGGGTHRVNGVYGVTFDATDTATVGEMEVSVVVASALIVFDKFFVVEEAVYDALFVAAAPGYVVDQPVNVTKWLGGAIPAVNVTGVPIIDFKYVLGTVSPAAAGTVRADAGDPLAVAVPGAYGAGTLGFAIGTYINSSLAAIQAKTVNLPASPAAVGSAMTLTAGERTSIANEVEAQIIDETDAEKVLTAITDKIASVNPSLAGLTVAAIASAVWASVTRTLTANTNLNDLSAAGVRAALGMGSANMDTQLSGISAKTTNLPAAPAAVSDIPTAATNAAAVRTNLTTELGRIDAATSTRLPTASYTAPDNAGISAAAADAGTLVTRLTSGRATNLDSLDAAVSTRLATSGYTVPPTAGSIAAAVLAAVVEGSVTVVQMFRGYASVLFGKASGLGTTSATFRDIGDTKDRIVSTVDVDGNRSTVTKDLS